MGKQLTIFRIGKHTSHGGDELSFTESHLAGTAKAYDPALHEAPIVVGHPELDAPAYGWIGSLEARDGLLFAEPTQIYPAFADAVAAGHFKKISASFYHPDSPSNPVGGVYYLRHVGFLGAQPPAIKGLGSASFGEEDRTEVVTVEFTEPTVVSLSDEALDLIRRLRASFISDADFSEPPPEEKPMADPKPKDKPPVHPEFAELQARLEQEREELQREREKLATQQRQARHQGHVEFAEKLASEGRLLPRQQAGVVALLDALPTDQKIEFGEGKDKVSTGPADWLKGFLKELPTQVDYSERAAPGNDPDDPPARPGTHQPAAGYAVDPARDRLHREAVAYAEKHKTDYLTAVMAVEKR